MQYGLIGYPLEHSYSKIIHEYLYSLFSMPSKYSLMSIQKNQIPDILSLIEQKQIQGINVTAPYKKEVLKYVKETSNLVQQLNVCNTIYLKNGKLYAENTDYYGFIESLKREGVYPKGKNCYIIGNGATAYCIYTALLDLGANPVIVARTPKKEEEIPLDGFHKTGYMIVNATPYGMYPNLESKPIIDSNILEGFEVAFDCIYRPFQTEFLKYSKKGINGLYMLVAQACLSFTLWTGHEVNIEKVYQKAKEWVE